MRKSDKKVDNQIRVALNKLCEGRLEDYEGFVWISYLANFDNFPQSLKIVCVFDNDDSLLAAKAAGVTNEIVKLVQAALTTIPLKLPKGEKQVYFDTEQACTHRHDGNWVKRFKSEY